MRKGHWAAAVALAGLLTAPAAAQKAKHGDVAEQEAAWAACQLAIEADADNWIGWRRDFGGGYADSYQFTDGRFDSAPSLLEASRLIDAIAAEYTSWCWRGDGSLAMIAVTMTSPDAIAESNGAMRPFIQREGRLYFGPEGHVLKVLGWYAEADGTVLGPLDTSDHALVRGCEPVDLKLSADDAQREYESVLGDIEGNRPDYAANEFDWCAVAEPGP